MKNKLRELANVEICEYCMLNLETCEITFSKNSVQEGFTGLYFRDENNFFAIYPSESGPVIFFEGKEYEINKELAISLLKQGKNRKFKIEDYNIEIAYTESPYIGFDVWSDEIDVDLFFMIEQRYKEQEFYDRYTIR